MIADNIFYPLLSFIPALLNVGILLYIYFFLPRGKTTNIFSLFVLFILLWQTEDTIVRLCASAETARFWDRMLGIGWAGFAPIAFHFACRYTGVKFLKNRFALPFIYLPFIILYLLYIASNEPGLFLYQDGWGWVNTPRPGTLDGLQRLVISAYVIAAVVILFRFAYKIRTHKGKRVQAFLIATGMLVPTIQGVITQIIYPVVLQEPEIPVTSTFMTFFSVATIIAIRKYQLFNISDSIEVETVLQNLKNIVLVVSPEKKIIYTNAFANKIVGDLHHHNDDKMIDALFSTPALANSFITDVFEKSLQGESVKNYTTSFHTTNGEQIDVLLSAEVIKNNNQVQGLLLVANDITQQIKTLQELETSNTELERFAYVASHDLQEPLRMVTNFLQMLQMRYTEKIDDTANTYINSAVKAASQMRNLIRDLLEYSRIGTTEDQIASIGMNQVVNEVLAQMQNEIEAKGATIDVGSLPVIPAANKTQMTQLIQNLVSNAIKYHSGLKPEVKINATTMDKYWRFAVSDNGIGIDPEFHEKVFVVFQRLHNKKEYSGTGIGLAICKKIVEQHGGRIWVESQPGAGSTFYFTLPQHIKT